MSKYSVRWIRKVRMSAQVTADNEDDACDKALDSAYDGNAEGEPISDDNFDVHEVRPECMDREDD